MNQYDATRKNVMVLSQEQQEQSGLQPQIYLHGRYLVENWLKSLNKYEATKRFYNEYHSRITEEYDTYLQESMATLHQRCTIMTEAVHVTIDNAHTRILDMHQNEIDNEI